ncbi:MAG: hypothetical protein COV99_06955 [Bacteroidetes bacterium CG12_big_fil_rev_8_21_14_0_65_60_17]|nr:MAG: hypothetical protein COV99_06955 [Bacteroidetes bacterium CG12_big_fil_rev_8_21_14_0_65_60_17]
MRTLITPLILLFTFLFSACDGDSVDVPVSAPVISVLSPDLSVAVVDAMVSVTLAVETDRNVTGVRVGGVDFSPSDAPDGAWEGTLPLAGGLNMFQVVPFLDETPAESSVLSVLKAQAELIRYDDNLMPFGVGGHTMTALTDGRVVMLGGSSGAGDLSNPFMHIHEPGKQFFTPQRSNLRDPRAGHSATRLPGDEVLVLGGGTSGNISIVSELTERVEIVGSDEQVREIPFVGDPIRRMYHTAWLSDGPDGTFVTVFGGRGDTQYVPTPLLGIRQDMRVFELRNDTLFARSEAIGMPIEPMAGHVTVPLDDAPLGQHKRFLVHGFRIGDTLTGETMFFDLTSPDGFVFATAPSPRANRLRPAGLHLPGVGAALFGGRTANGELIDPAIEVFVDEAGRFFSIPVVGDKPLVDRFGHQATLLPNGEIYLSGGFNGDNAPLFDSEFIQITF